MNFDLTRLNNNIDKEVNVDLDYKFLPDELTGTDLLDCNCSVKGEISKNSLGEIMLNLTVNGIMVLPCAITLKPVNYPFNIEIEGTIDELLEKNAKKCINTLDIFPIIWENILMEIPMRVVSADAKDIKLSGDGWKLVTEEETNKPLSGLADLLDDREVK